MNDLIGAFLKSLVSLVICMLAGFICRRARLLDDALTSGLTELLIKVALPCTVFLSMMRPFSHELLIESGEAFVFSAAVYLASGFLGFAAYKLFDLVHKNKNIAGPYRTIMIFALIFPNVGYMGFPVTQAVFGDEGMIYASLANASFNIIVFSLGIRMFQRHSQQEKDKTASTVRLLATNTALAATLLGFIFFVTGIRLPETVSGGISNLSAITTPISMIVVGSLLGKRPLKSLFDDLSVFPVIAVRHLVIPLAAYAVLNLFIHNKTMLGVLVVLAAMPVASITAIFAGRYNTETERASKMVALSTMLSVVTVPAVAFVTGII